MRIRGLRRTTPRIARPIATNCMRTSPSTTFIPDKDWWRDRPGVLQPARRASSYTGRMQAETKELKPFVQSLDLQRRAEGYFPGGVNSPVRAFRAVGGHPPFVVRGEGAY